VNTTLCYIEKDGCYLMLHRVKKENDISHDKWLGVGGKFEDKESPEDCLLREVREETGLTLNRWRYCGIVTFVSNQYETEWMHLFTSNTYTGNIKECDEGVLEWIAKDKIFELPIWEGDKIFFKLMQEERSFFSLKVVYDGDVLKSAILNGQMEWEVNSK
jgi:8-oxo-dGTP diphosphatase